MRVEISFIDEPLELLNDTIRRASFASVELVSTYVVADVGVNRELKQRRRRRLGKRRLKIELAFLL